MMRKYVFNIFFKITSSCLNIPNVVKNKQKKTNTNNHKNPEIVKAVWLVGFQQAMVERICTAGGF